MNIHRLSYGRGWKSLVMVFLLGLTVALSTSAQEIATPGPSDKNGDPKKRKGKKEVLMKADFGTWKDSLGFEWEIRDEGYVSDGSNDAFDGGLRLSVNGHNFDPDEKCWMTTDEKEYVLIDTYRSIKITRRVRLLSDRGAVRYLEIFENTGEKSQNVKAKVYTRLGSTCKTAYTNEGRPFKKGGQMKKDEVGFVCISRGGSRPSVMFLVGESDTDVTSRIQIKGRRYVNVFYNFSLESGQKLALLHLVGQRRGVNTAQPSGLFKPFYRRHPRKVQIPRGVRKHVANFEGQGGLIELPPGKQILQPMWDMLDVRNASRGQRDVLVLADDRSMEGKLKCEGMSVKTRFGREKVPFSNLAALVGDLPHSRNNIIYLRNGEILTGKVEVSDMVFELATGVTMKLSAGDINLVVRPQSEKDGKPAEKITGYLTTHGGERIALAGDSEDSSKGVTVIQATIPWGNLKLPLNQIHMLSYQRRPQPFCRLVLRDGSVFPAILTGEKVRFRTIRFGEIQLPPPAIARLVCASGLKEVDSEKAAPTDPRAGYAVMQGDNLIVGEMSRKKLNLTTSNGTTVINPDDIYLMEKIQSEADRSSFARFSIDLSDGSRLSGMVKEEVLSLTSGKRKLQIPVGRLQMFCQPKAKPEGTIQW